jgi:hypothetical protein
VEMEVPQVPQEAEIFQADLAASVKAAPAF